MYKSCYVQSPMTTRYDITSYIKYIARTESKNIDTSYWHDSVFDTYVPSTHATINNPNDDIDQSEYQDPDLSLQVLFIQPEE